MSARSSSSLVDILLSLLRYKHEQKRQFDIAVNLGAAALARRKGEGLDRRNKIRLTKAAKDHNALLALAKQSPQLYRLIRKYRVQAKDDLLEERYAREGKEMLKREPFDDAIRVVCQRIGCEEPAMAEALRQLELGEGDGGTGLAGSLHELDRQGIGHHLLTVLWAEHAPVMAELQLPQPKKPVADEWIEVSEAARVMERSSDSVRKRLKKMGATTRKSRGRSNAHEATVNDIIRAVRQPPAWLEEIERLRTHVAERRERG